MAGYVVNPMVVANKLPELISEKAAQHKINIEKSILLLQKRRTKWKQNNPTSPLTNQPKGTHLGLCQENTKLEFF